MLVVDIKFIMRAEFRESTAPALISIPTGLVFNPEAVEERY